MAPSILIAPTRVSLHFATYSFDSIETEYMFAQSHYVSLLFAPSRYTSHYCFAPLRFITQRNRRVGTTSSYGNSAEFLSPPLRPPSRHASFIVSNHTFTTSHYVLTTSHYNLSTSRYILFTPYHTLTTSQTCSLRFAHFHYVPLQFHSIPLRPHYIPPQLRYTSVYVRYISLHFHYISFHFHYIPPHCITSRTTFTTSRSIVLRPAT